MNQSATPALGGMDPAGIAAIFHRAGMRARERRVASRTGPRWAVLVQVPDVDLWVEARARDEAWRKAVAYAQEVGLLP